MLALWLGGGVSRKGLDSSAWSALRFRGVDGDFAEIPTDSPALASKPSIFCV